MAKTNAETLKSEKVISLKKCALIVGKKKWSETWWMVYTASKSGRQCPKTCTVLFQKQIWEISSSRWFYYKNVSRRTVRWMPNCANFYPSSIMESYFSTWNSSLFSIFCLPSQSAEN